MKRLIKYICQAALVLAGFAACETDNLEGPNASIKGTIYDHNNKPLQTEQGSGNMKIRYIELSWKEEVVSPRDLNVKIDGTYENSKMFAGTYLMHPYQGGFYPPDSAEMKTVEIKGTATVDFQVTPYLEVEWVNEPVIVHIREKEHPNYANNPSANYPEGDYFQASAKFSLVGKTGKTHPGVQYGRFFVSNTHFAADNNKLAEYSRELSFNNADAEKIITFTADQPVKYTGMTFYFRIGFKCNDADKKYNYTSVKEIKVL
ncbi:MAG: DUF3823 domain-containing protein [Tannerella sp.]|nr:DUF3823 domain-containing protein [Tannerella sp.]